MTVGMTLLNEIVGRLGDPPPFGGIAEPLDGGRCVGKVRRQRNVMPIRFEDVVIPAAHQYLAGAGRCRLTMSGGDAFGIDRTRRLTGEEPRLDLIDSRVVLGERLVPDRGTGEERLHPI